MDRLEGDLDSLNREIEKLESEIQNGEKEASEKTGRSGALPWIGVGWYRTSFTVPVGCENVGIIHI